MEFKWLNESTVKQSGDRIEILAPGKTDFFCGSMDECQEGILPESLCNAPYYYTEVEGDFVLRVKVSHGFQETYDSASVMVMKDLNCWAKCCFELTDFGTHAAVSVVTKGDSDDANGCNLKGNTAWLQVCRVGNNFAFHYSVDGENFYILSGMSERRYRDVRVFGLSGGFRRHSKPGSGGKHLGTGWRQSEDIPSSPCGRMW